ncbi:hypothetical protein BT69DRAFT_361804 [Atractiella rhizophila]|nr:hypothetical protein BT69DRAFT_361804 [Atractiella rhizophila]
MEGFGEGYVDSDDEHRGWGWGKISREGWKRIGKKNGQKSSGDPTERDDCLEKDLERIASSKKVRVKKAFHGSGSSRSHDSLLRKPSSKSPDASLQSHSQTQPASSKPVLDPAEEHLDTYLDHILSAARTGYQPIVSQKKMREIKDRHREREVGGRESLDFGARVRDLAGFASQRGVNVGKKLKDWGATWKGHLGLEKGGDEEWLIPEAQSNEVKTTTSADASELEGMPDTLPSILFHLNESPKRPFNIPVAKVTLLSPDSKFSKKGDDHAIIQSPPATLLSPELQPDLFFEESPTKQGAKGISDYLDSNELDLGREMLSLTGIADLIFECDGEKEEVQKDTYTALPKKTKIMRRGRYSPPKSPLDPIFDSPAKRAKLSHPPAIYSTVSSVTNVKTPSITSSSVLFKTPSRATLVTGSEEMILEDEDAVVSVMTKQPENKAETPSPSKLSRQRKVKVRSPTSPGLRRGSRLSKKRLNRGSHHLLLLPLVRSTTTRQRQLRRDPCPHSILRRPRDNLEASSCYYTCLSTT